MPSNNRRRKLNDLWYDAKTWRLEAWLWLLQYGRYVIPFVGILVAGTLAVCIMYPDPRKVPDGANLADMKLNPLEAAYAVFTLIFFQPDLVEFDKAPLLLQIIFFAVPVAGLFIIAPGVLRFGEALLDHRKRRENRLMALADTFHDHIVVCGLGRIGYRVVNELLDWGEKVIGIENDANARFLEEIRQEDVPVLIGDAKQEELLEQARVQQASAIVVCTEDDMTNMQIALEARELNPDIKVVMRMFDAQMATRVRNGFHIHTAFSTSALAAPVFAAAATRAQISHSFYVDEEDDLMVARMTVKPGSVLEGNTIAQVKHKLDVSVILYKRAGYLNPQPAPETIIRADDCLVVFASRETLARLGEMSGESPNSARKRAWNVPLHPWLERLFSREKRPKQ